MKNTFFPNKFNALLSIADANAKILKYNQADQTARTILITLSYSLVLFTYLEDLCPGRILIFRFIENCGSFFKCFERRIFLIGVNGNFSYLFVTETMSPLHVWSKVCMAPFHVWSYVCMAPFMVGSKLSVFVSHIEGSNDDGLCSAQGSENGKKNS